jgi:hypothetical protein
MSDKVIYLYKVYCVTESTWKESWGTEPPSVCPDGHAIDPSASTVVDTVSEKVMTINEETVKTGGNWAVEDVHIQCDASSEKDVIKVWPFPITALNMHVLLNENMEGDAISVFVGENTTVGAITAPITAGDTVINVSPTVVQYMCVGYWFRLLDASNGNTEEWRVVEVNKSLNTVTIEAGATNSYSPASPTYVQLTVKRVDHVRLPGFGGDINLGGSKVGGSHLPANTPVTVRYHNNGAIAKSFYGYVEILY